MTKQSLFILAAVAILCSGCPSTPTPPATVDVPDVTGVPRFEAAARLASAGLTLGAVSEVNDADTAREYVLSQNPLPGVAVDGGTAVALTVSIGAQEDPGGAFTPGTRVPAESERIGAGGGEISANVGSEGAAVSADFPDGALPENVNVTLAYDTGSVTPAAGQPGEAVILLETPGVWSFDQPVALTFTLSAAKVANAVPVPYLIDADGDWRHLN